MERFKKLLKTWQGKAAVGVAALLVLYVFVSFLQSLVGA